MKNNFLSKTLKGTKLYIIITLLFSAIYSRLVVLVPMFIRICFRWNYNGK